MVATAPPPRQARVLRWQSPPWDEHHPDWLRLDRALAPDHRARLIARVVDALDLTPVHADFSKGFGSPSWHPALLLKLILYELDRKELSPAQWCRAAQESIPVQWLIYGASPCRASLYHCRQRFSPDLLQRLNQQVLQAARQESFCSARRGSLDGTFVAAKGSRHQLLNLQRLDKRLALLEQALALPAEEAVPRRPRWMARTTAGRVRQRDRYRRARASLQAKLLRHQQRQSRRAKKKRQPAQRVVLCVNEPEAVVGKDKDKVVRPLYNVQLLRDLDSPFLLGYGVFAATSDAGLLPPMLERTHALAGTRPEELLVDSAYASVADLRVCQDAQVTLYAPSKQGPADRGTRADGQRHPLPVLSGTEGEAAARYYGKEQFVWNEAEQCYTCPAGQRLERVSSGQEKREHGGSVQVDQYGTKACAGCPQRGACTRSKYGRRIKRMAEEPLVEALRQRMASAEGRERYRLRKQTIEREFADVKQHRGLRQLHGYGLRQAETQVGLLVLLHNGTTLLRQRQARAEAG